MAGEAAVVKFKNAKVGALPYGSQYVSGVEDHLEGCRTLIELLDDLKEGLAISSVDVDSYYAADKRWPAGMRIEGSRLVDTWPKEVASGQEEAPSRKLESMKPEDFDFDFPSIEIPKHELNEEEAAELANKLLAAFYNQPRNSQDLPKPRK